MNNLKIIVLFLISTFCFAQNKVDVYFDFNEVKPNATSQNALNDWIKNHSNAEIYQISGFCDTVGTNVFNKKLAKKRINSIEKILKNTKIQFSQELQKEVFGEEFESSLNQEENRRVTFFYKQKEVKKSYAIDLSSAKVGQFLELKGLNFVGGQDIVLPQSLPILEDLLKVMSENKNLSIEIQGHICCNSYDSADLSTKRANAVFQFLLDNGISLNRIFYRGFGSSTPIFPLPEKTEEERIANRRVEILILQK
jgi:outer membrane protein OmpA-like peptidoglycan-associated protein